MTNLKKILIVVLTIAVLVSLYSAVSASSDFGIIPDGTNTANNLVNNATPVTNVQNNVQNPVGTLGTTNNASNTSLYNSTNNLPKTGVGDYTMITAIILLAIVAIYAYKKVVDYKNI